MFVGVPLSVALGLKIVHNKITDSNKTIIKTNQTIKKMEADFEKSKKLLDSQYDSASKSISKLASLELEILQSFRKFSDLIEVFQNRPEFEYFELHKFELPQLDMNELCVASNKAGKLLEFLSNTMVMTEKIALVSGGVASVCTGGLILGSCSVVSLPSFTPALLIGGWFLNKKSQQFSDKVEIYCQQIRTATEKSDEACQLLYKFEAASEDYISVMTKVNQKYSDRLNYLSFLVNTLKKRDWKKFSNNEKTKTKELILLVGLLYNMCKVNFIQETSDENGVNKLNKEEIANSVERANGILKNMRKY